MIRSNSQLLMTVTKTKLDAHENLTDKYQDHDFPHEQKMQIGTSGQFQSLAMFSDYPGKPPVDGGGACSYNCNGWPNDNCKVRPSQVSQLP